MINERERRSEALSLFQVMEVSVEIPHNLRYRQGAAKYSVHHLLYLSRSKRQIIRNLQRERTCPARPRAERGHNDEIIPFSSSHHLLGAEISNQRTSNNIGSPAAFGLVGQLKMEIRNMLPMCDALKSLLRRLSFSVSETSYMLSTTV